MRNASFDSGSRRPLRRAVMWIGIFSLLLSILTPLVQLNEANAAQDGQECEPGFVFDEQAGECVEEQPAQPECGEGEVFDPNTGACVPDPAQQQDMPVGVQVEKYDCPAEASGTLDDLFSMCVQNANSIQMTHGSDVTGESTNSTTNYTEWLDLPAGSHYVYEQVPDGYGQPIVYCGVYVPQQSQPSPNEMNIQNGNAIGWELAPGEYLYCWWFNIPDAGFGEIHILKYDCAGYEEDPHSASFDDLAAACQETMAGVSFYPGFDGVANIDDRTETDGSGEVHFDEVPAGDVTVIERLPDGYLFTAVFCNYHVQDEANNSAPEETTTSTQDGASSIEWQMEAGYLLDCYWFNFPEEEYNYVDLYKYVCPPGIGHEEDQAYYEQNCELYTEGADFDFEYPDGSKELKRTDDQGHASWSGVGMGDWAVTEFIPAGYGNPILYCRWVEWPDNANYTDEWTRFDPPGGVHEDTFEYEKGLRYECYWFNISLEDDEEMSHIRFEKYWCPEGLAFVQAPTHDDLVGACQETGPDGTSFSLEGPGGPYDDKTVEGSPGASGTWENLPIGEYTVTENFPNGAYQLQVFCYLEPIANGDANNGLAEPEAWDVVNGNGIEWASEPNYTWVCAIFNFPMADDGYNYVDFSKYACPFDTPADEDKAYYEQNCQPVEGWEFDLQYVGGGGTQSTNSEGFTGWSGLPMGTWQAQEVLPEGYGEPIVWCRYVEWPDEAGITGDWAMFEAPGGFYENGFGYEGMRIECHWYNFAPEGEGENVLELYKYLCPEGASPDADPATLAENCTLAPDVVFFLSSIGGQLENPQQATDSNGYASWTGAPVGTWLLTEATPEGYGNAIAYCRYVEWPDSAPDVDDSTFSMPFEGNQLAGEFAYDNMRLVCGIFNFQFEGNDLTLYKYFCDEGLAYGDWGFQDFLDSCVSPHQGVEFTGANNGTSVPVTTDGNGQLQWTGIPVGPWGVTETVPDGYGEPIVYCRWIEWPEGIQVSEEYEPYPVTEGFFLTDFKYAQMQLECYVFNIPYEQNWIDITKWWCSEDVTMPHEQSAGNLLEECASDTVNVDFLLEYSGGSESMTTDDDDRAEWSGLPIGPWSMHETIPEGYGDPVVWCRWMEWPDGAEFTNDPFKYDAPAGSFSGGFEMYGMRLHCDIFNIPDYDPGHITVYKWYCAIGVPVDSSPEYLRDTCDLVTTGVNFSLEYGETSLPMTTNSEGMAEWSSVPTGGWELHETSASSYGAPVIHCQWVEWPGEAEGDITGDLFMPEAQNSSIVGSHDYPGMRLVCYWFNFGYEGGDNWVIFYKYYCAPGSDYGDNFQEWLDGCPEAMHGTSFTLENEQGSYPKTTSGGMAEWTGLEDGELSVQEELPTGYEEPVVWCHQIEYTPGEPIQAVDLGQFEMSSAPDGRWERSLDGGPYRIVCYWFNIPGEHNTVTVYKYNCEYKPVGFNSLSEWLDACPTKGHGVGFTMTDIDGADHKETVDGKAEWTDVPLGEFSLTEDVLPGYGEPVIWCGWTAYYEGAIYDAFPTNVPAPGGVYYGEVTAPNTTWFCYWFNIPDDDSRITVYKYNCPQDVLIENSLHGYQQACAEEGDGIEFTLDNMNGASSKEIMGGTATWNDVPQGDFTLTESVPFGYGEPIWWCSFTGYQDGAIFDGFAQQYEAPGGVLTGSIDYEVTYFACWVFNFPDYEREVSVYKWYCPEGLAPESEDFMDWQDTCDNPMSGIGFNLSNGAGSYGKNTNVGGKASWYGVEPGDNSLREQHLPGYEPPIVYCSLEAFFEDGAAYAEGFTPNPVSDNSVTKDLDYAGFKWICHFFNIPKGPGEITIYKWYCPPGYDVHAWGADPKMDCTQAQDGVPYVLDQPVGPNQMSETGNSIPGGVYFGDLQPGKHVVTEMVPSDVSYVFIWDCTGGDIPKVHPKPLTWGNVLHVQVAGGDSIVCNWYNVPDPEDGWLTLYKYQCWTMTYTSDVDCDTYEFGASFELFQVDGNVSQGVGATNAGGAYTWNDLEEGAYSLDEISHEPCKITSTKVDEMGNAWVDAGDGTVVKVYNCQSSDTSTTPVPSGKVPGKYPNTGVEPGIEGPAALPQDDAEETEPADVIEPDSGTPTAEEAAAEFYEISCLNQEQEQEGQGRAPATETAVDAPADDAGLPPFLQPTPDPDAPEEPEATAEATPSDEAIECERGAVPEKMVIDAANVNHEVEILEIIDGVMQAPTGPNVVSWYKETARLGEFNNIVIAAHVNWWNVPEGPFFHLQNLEEGERIEITGEDGTIYVYEVQWVRQESNLEAPDAEVVGPTGEQSLTLITCGGEWDASISEYNERTVARAIQVDVIPAEEAETAQDAWTYPLAA